MIKQDADVVIISHYYAVAESSGPPQDLRDFLLPKVRRLVYIEHPFPYNASYGEDTRSYATIYENGAMKKKLNTFRWRGPDISYYIKDILVTLWFMLRTGLRFDLCVALDNLNTLSVLPLRKLRLVRKLVYYTIDFTPQRFKGRLLNSVYHKIDKICCYHADAIWNLAPRIMEGRRDAGVDLKRCAPDLILPMGAHLSKIKRLPLQEIDRYKIVFVGHLVKGHGVQLVLEALPEVRKQVPEARFVVIGKGEYAKELQRTAGQRGVEDIVDFKGFVQDHRDLEAILCASAVGVAPYMPEDATISFYTDPGKPKLYLGCGLPVVITDVPAIAREIGKAGAGVVIRYDQSDMVGALIRLLKDDAFYETSRDNALELSKEFDTENILTGVVDRTFDIFEGHG